MYLSDYVERSEPVKERIILSCTVRLDRKAVLEALGSDSIYIDGNNFKVPEAKLLECLVNNKYGFVKLDLEQIVKPVAIDEDDLPF